MSSYSTYLNLRSTVRGVYIDSRRVCSVSDVDTRSHKLVICAAGEHFVHVMVGARRPKPVATFIAWVESAKLDRPSFFLPRSFANPVHRRTTVLRISGDFMATTGIFRFAEHAADVAALQLDTAQAALSAIEGASPIVLRGLLPGDSRAWLPAAALEGDEQVTLLINPLGEASAPVKLPNGTHIRPAEHRLKLTEAAALLRGSPAERGYHA